MRKGQLVGDQPFIRAIRQLVSIFHVVAVVVVVGGVLLDVSDLAATIVKRERVVLLSSAVIMQLYYSIDSARSTLSI